MPKIFTEEQRAGMQERIIEAGRTLFREKGFQKTSVNTITDAVGIAKGTFYNFFSSKEMLFMTILGEFEREKFRMIETCFTETGNPVEELESFLILMYQSVSEEPIFQWLYREHVLEKIMQKITPKMKKEMIQADIEAVELILSSTKPRGFLTAVTPRDLAEQLRGMFLMTVHMDEIGTGDFSRFMEIQIAIFVNGLAALEGSKL